MSIINTNYDVTPYLPYYNNVKDNYDVSKSVEALEHARATLIHDINIGTNSAETHNAIYKIEEALLLLDHRRQRRELAGIYTLPVPENNNVVQVIQRITQPLTMLVHFFTDHPEGSKCISSITIENTIPHREIGLIMAMTERHFNDVIKFNPWVINHTDDTFEIGLLVVSSHTDALEIINSKYHEVRKTIYNLREVKKPQQLAIYDIKNTRNWVYEKDMSTVTPEVAINCQTMLQQYVNNKTNSVGFGVGNICPGLYCFKDDLNQFDEIVNEVKLKLDSYIESNNSNKSE